MKDELNGLFDDEPYVRLTRPDLPRKEQLEQNAHDALWRLFQYIIRTEDDWDPDHSGPEDAAEVLARETLWDGLLLRQATSDPRELVERF